MVAVARDATYFRGGCLGESTEVAVCVIYLVTLACISMYSQDSVLVFYVVVGSSMIMWTVSGC